MAKISEMSNEQLKRVIQEGKKELEERKRLKEETTLTIETSFFKNASDKKLGEIDSKVKSLFSDLKTIAKSASSKNVREKARNILNNDWNPGNIIGELHDSLLELKEIYDESDEQRVVLEFK